MTKNKDLRVLSHNFRRISSNLLNSNADNADVNLIRFKTFIDEDPFISSLLHKTIDGIEYDFKNCFRIENSGWCSMDIPVDEKLHT